MKRLIKYPRNGVSDLDFMLPIKWVRRTINMLASGIYGNNLTFTGFAVSNGTGLNLVLDQGMLLSPPYTEEVTPMGSLPIDNNTSRFVIDMPTPTVIGPFTAPTAAGQAINYLICGAVSVTDGDNAVLYYQNADNLSQTFRGVGNNGLPQPTTRNENVVFSVLAGSAAAAGSQVTPNATAGTVPLYVVTVYTGQTSVTLANVVKHSAASFLRIDLYSLSAGIRNLIETAGLTLANSDAGQFLQACYILFQSKANNHQHYAVYGTPGTYSFQVPAGVYRLRVEGVGAGGPGGGGLANNYGGGGGGAGGWFRLWVDVLPGQFYVFTVGAAGQRQGAGGQGSGGGSTSFGPLLGATAPAFAVANGGLAGQSNGNAAGGQGGFAAIASGYNGLPVGGSAGTDGQSFALIASTNNTVIYGGNGGSSFYGGAGRAALNTPDNDARGFGSGGGGGYNQTTLGGIAGGGLIEIFY